MEQSRTKSAALNSTAGINIKEYVDIRFTEAQRAIDKAESMMRDRLQGMNEFRDQLKDQAGRFVTRDEIIIIHTKLNEDVRLLRSKADKAEGKASANAVFFTAILAAVGLVLGVLNLVK